MKILTAGKNYFLWGDIGDDRCLKRFLELLKGLPIYLFYSEIPWSDKSLEYWRNKAGLFDKGAGFEEIIMRTGVIIKNCGAGDIFYNISRKNKEKVKELLSGYAPPFRKEWKIFYGAPYRNSDKIQHYSKPSYLVYHSKKNRRFSENSPEGRRSEQVLDWVFSHFGFSEGVYVVDPFVGRGLTARVAYRYGLHCVGMDINLGRLEEVIRWFKKRGVD